MPSITITYDLNRYYPERLPRRQHPVFHTLTAYVRQRYESALALMDRVIANSQNVKRNKRVDLIIRAFLEQPERRLIIASGGSDERRLRELAGDATNIRFTGWVDQSTLQQLVGRSIAKNVPVCLRGRNSSSKCERSYISRDQHRHLYDHRWIRVSNVH